MKPSKDCVRWIAIADQHALEETPSASDVAFYERHLATCDACRDEAEGFLAIRRIIDSELVPVERPRPKRRRFAPLYAAAAGFAAAAAVLIVMRRPVEVTPTIVADERGSCLELEDASRVCLAPGSRLRPLADGNGFELLAGRVAVALEPQPPGELFVIRGAGYDVTALGTVFSVDVGAISTVRLLSGKVAVTDRRSGEQWLLPPAHRFDGSVKPLIAGDREVVEGLVGAVTEHPAELARMQPAPPAEPDTDGDSGSPSAAPKSRRHKFPRKHTPAIDPAARSVEQEPEPAAPVGPDVTERLRRIRELRASGHYTEAATGYEELIAAHPGTAEAQAALVSLGELRLGPLRDPSGARRAFEIYLSGPSGTLEESARYGLIRALRQSSKEPEERRAIATFLDKFPKSIHAAGLRSRLSQLE